jgi:hypothetical protein
MKHFYRCRRLLVAVVVLAILWSAWGAPVLAQDSPPSSGAANHPLYLPTIMRDKCHGLRTPTVYGVQVYGTTGSKGPYFDDLEASGASWVRTEIAWEKIEPTNTTPDQYNWRPVDEIVAGAYERCYPLVLTILGNPSWAAEFPDGPIYTANLPDFAQFMRALAERYDGDGFQDAPGSPLVRYFELYNEPDVGEVGATERWGNYGARYAAMLKAVYPAVKAASPQALVVFGGIAYDFFASDDPATSGPFVRNFLPDVLANGGGAYFDIMNYHFYPLFGSNWTKNFPLDGPGLVEKTAAIRAVLQKYKINKPIIITEMGWHNNILPPPDIYGDDRLQVRLVQQLYVQALAAGVPMAAWWPLNDLDNGYQYNSGLVSNISASSPPERKPAFLAFRAMTEHLTNVRFVRAVPASELQISGGDREKSKALVVYEFSDNATDHPIYVAWTNQTDAKNAWGQIKAWKDTAPAVGITLEGHAATIYDAYWNAKQSLVNKEPKLQFTVTGDPVYVVVSKE